MDRRKMTPMEDATTEERIRLQDTAAKEYREDMTSVRRIIEDNLGGRIADNLRSEYP